MARRNSKHTGVCASARILTPSILDITELEIEAGLTLSANTTGSTNSGRATHCVNFLVLVRR
jgi:hypothetical protein